MPDQFLIKNRDCYKRKSKNYPSWSLDELQSDRDIIKFMTDKNIKNWKRMYNTKHKLCDYLSTQNFNVRAQVKRPAQIQRVVQQRPAQVPPLPPVPVLNRGVNRSTCNNDNTFVMFDNVKDIPEKNFLQLSDNRCYDINELYDYLISTRKNVNPYDNNKKLWNNSIDRNKILYHKSLSSPKKTKLYTLFREIETDEKHIFEYCKKNPEILDEILKLGYICVSDNSSNKSENPDVFNKSAIAISNFKAYIDNTSAQDKENIYKIKYPGEFTIGEIMDNSFLSTQCIHGIGTRLIRIYMYIVLKAGEKSSFTLSPLFKRYMNKNIYFFYVPEVITDKDIDYAFILLLEYNNDAVKMGWAYNHNIKTQTIDFMNHSIYPRVTLQKYLQYVKDNIDTLHNKATTYLKKLEGNNGNGNSNGSSSSKIKLDITTCYGNEDGEGSNISGDTYSEIIKENPEFIVTHTVGTNKYCFSVDTIINLFNTSYRDGIVKNPYNPSDVLPLSLLETATKIKELYGKDSDSSSSSSNRNSKKSNSNKTQLTREQQMNFRIVHIFSLIDKLGNYTDEISNGILNGDATLLQYIYLSMYIYLRVYETRENIHYIENVDTFLNRISITHCLKMAVDNPVSKLYIQSYIMALLEKVANDTLKLDVLLRRESSLNDTERALFIKKKNTLNSLIYYMKMIILLFESPDVSGLFNNIYNNVKTYYDHDVINKIRIRNLFLYNIRLFITNNIQKKKRYIIENMYTLLTAKDNNMVAMNSSIDTILQYYMHSLVNNLQILLIQ